MDAMGWDRTTSGQDAKYGTKVKFLYKNKPVNSTVQRQTQDRRDAQKCYSQGPVAAVLAADKSRQAVFVSQNQVLRSDGRQNVDLV